MMNIIPITTKIDSLGPVGGGPSISQSGKKETSSFYDYFDEALKNIDELNEIKTQDAYDLALGDAENLAEIATNAQKYEVSVQLMVQMRNKILDSYQEIMRINV